MDNTTTLTFSTDESSCQSSICSLMTGVSRTNTTCLQDPSYTVETISLQMCGNGIVEQGEDCDPGQGITSPCCDSETCKFKNGALCDPDSSPCCTAQCGFAPPTQVCRPTKDAKCDVQETCTGTSSSCPSDVVIPNGQSCGANDLACASGQCTSVSLQCQTLGASMNLTKECPNQSSNTCQVSCQDPTQANQCILLTALLIDGSPCGYGGVCASGKCQSSGLISTAKAWFVQNLQIGIPVAVVAGLIAIVLLWFICSAILRCCRGRPECPITPVIVPRGPDMRHQRLGSFDEPIPSGPMGIGGPGPAPPVRSESRPAGPSRSGSRSIAGPSRSGPQPVAGPSRSETRPVAGPSRSIPRSQSHWVDESRYNGSDR